ncbi:GIY-YIG nuclease family protein [Candidatus Parcubacteria bacterium]|nr:GIY-YIG nuclease family protein [Candidatus Parcubacteria bacterium]MBI4385410.1 GIY-YIG nuclease family protein [Candidatus Parcubacteria bacterium]
MPRANFIIPPRHCEGVRLNFAVQNLGGRPKQSRVKDAVAKCYYVYIATNKRNTVLYAGVTNNIDRRMHEHRHKLIPGFSARYNVSKLVCYEVFPTAYEAIAAEKKIKAGSRRKKIDLIKTKNSAYRDLLPEIASLRSQ